MCAVSPGVKWAGREADHYPLFSAEFKNAHVFMAWYLVKHRDNLPFVYLSPNILRVMQSMETEWAGLEVGRMGKTRSIWALGYKG